MAVQEFERWYWPVDLLQQFCRELDLPVSGSKAELRQRVAFALEDPERPPLPLVRRKMRSGFNWSNERLDRSTIITDDISFGPNVRGFLKKEIGSAFVCHSDFMTWVRSNTGASLADAIDAWKILEERKKDPEFRREIASCNNYLQ